MGQFFGSTADTATEETAAETTASSEASLPPPRTSEADTWPCLEGVQSALCGRRPPSRELADVRTGAGMPGPVSEDSAEVRVEYGAQLPTSPGSGGMLRDQSRATLQLPGATSKVVAPPPLALASLRQRSAPVRQAPQPTHLDRAVSEMSMRALLVAGRQPFTELTLHRLIPSASTSEASMSGILTLSPCSGAAAAAREQKQDVPDVLAESELQDDASLASFGVDVSTADLLPGMVPLTGVTRCLICCEDVAEVFMPDRLCQYRACEGAFCSPCLETYYSTKVEESRYAVPCLRCPSCNGYVRNASWRGCVGDRVYRQMETNCADLLNLRCIECDEPGTLLVDATPSQLARERILDKLRSDLTQAQLRELQQWWSLYSRGEADATHVATLLEPSQGTDVDEGVPSTKLAERMQMLAKLIEDPARRAVFQLAFLRRWPKIRSTCCFQQHCFKCKVGSHHTGLSCEEVQRRQAEEVMSNGGEAMQFCPGCGVATVKSEGCNHMICICGEEWTWQGKERWVDDWIGNADAENVSEESYTSSDGS